MRARNIKPAFFKNETIGTLPYECRILFVGLWLMADKDGFLEYRPLRIKAEIFPYDNIDSGKITKLLEKLCNLDPRDRLIEIWVENGESKFIQIINFKKHQSPHKNEMSYKIKELLNDPEFSCNYTNFHGITGPFNERGMMNDESGMMNDESHAETENDFLKFWDMYGKKNDRKKCESKWLKIKPADKDKIFKTLSGYILSTPDQRYRKNPLTYLNGECWNDEITKKHPTQTSQARVSDYSGDYSPEKMEF